MKADMCDLMHFNGHTGYSRTCKEIGMHECQSTCQSNIYTWVVRVAPNIRYCVFCAHISKRTAKSYAINWFDRGTEQSVCHKCMYRHRCWLHAEWHQHWQLGRDTDVHLWHLTPTGDWQHKMSNSLTLLTSVNEQLYLCTSMSTTSVWPLPAASITGVVLTFRKHSKRQGKWYKQRGARKTDVHIISAQIHRK